MDDSCRTLQVQHLEGLAADASQHDAVRFGRCLASIIAEPARNLAMTLTRVQQQERQRTIQRTIKYVAYSALAVAGVTVVTVVIVHRVQASSKRSSNDTSGQGAKDAGGTLTAKQAGGTQSAKAGGPGSSAADGGWWTWQK